jgi:hypothetical protein
MDDSQITDELCVGTTPDRAGQDHRRSHGMQLVTNMRFLRGRRPPDGRSALRYLRLHGVDNPLFPNLTRFPVRESQAALDVMRRGGGICVYCSRGRHRSVAMAAAILIAQRLSPTEATSQIKQRRAIADPEAARTWPRLIEFARKMEQAATNP